MPTVMYHQCRMPRFIKSPAPFSIHVICSLRSCDQIVALQEQVFKSRRPLLVILTLTHFFLKRYTHTHTLSDTVIKGPTTWMSNTFEGFFFLFLTVTLGDVTGSKYNLEASPDIPATGRRGKVSCWGNLRGPRSPGTPRSPGGRAQSTIQGVYQCVCETCTLKTTDFTDVIQMYQKF